METFTFCYTVGPTANVTNRALTAQFGDGFEQAAGDGINTKQSVWSIQLVGTESEMGLVRAFLDSHGQWKRFLWTDPLGDQGVYRAAAYGVTAHGGDDVSITVEMKQTGSV
jgi:phage-related protein